MAMSMTLKFRTLAQFFFMEWQSDTVMQLVLGCICCMILAFTMIAMPQIRRKLLKKLQENSNNKNSILTQSEDRQTNYSDLNWRQKVISAICYIIYAFLHVVVMVIIMNMNFYVIFSVVFGATIGYFFTSNEYCPKKAVHQCCDSKDSQRTKQRQLVEEAQTN